jgi:hypothetical protein
MMMLWAIPGLVLLVLSFGALFALLPRGGKVKPVVVMPYLDSIIPLAMITAMVFGVAMLVVAFT